MPYYTKTDINLSKLTNMYILIQYNAYWKLPWSPDGIAYWYFENISISIFKAKCVECKERNNFVVLLVVSAVLAGIIKVI